MQEYVVIVIGAGIAGVSAAAQLAADAKVAILEMESQPGYHATGRSAAYFAPAYGNATVRNLTAASEGFYREPPPGFTDVPLLRPRPALFIGGEDQRAGLESLHADNPSLERVDGDALRRLVPVLKENQVLAGLLDAGGGDLDVAAILQGFLQRFRARGGRMLTDHGVGGLAYKRGAWRVVAGDSEFAAPVVVNAAGAWADRVAVLAGLQPVGLTPMRRTAFLVDAPAGIEIADWPLVVDADEQFYFKPDAGRILVSPADETPSEPCDAQAEDLDIAVAVDRLTRVADIDVRHVRHRWAGLRTFAPDRTFVVGFDPRADGFFWLAGQGGYGVQTAPGIARLAAHLLTGRELPADFTTVGDSVTAVLPDRLLR